MITGILPLAHHPKARTNHEEDIKAQSVGGRRLWSGRRGLSYFRSSPSLGQQTRASGGISEAPNFGYCLNTSTIRGQKLGLVEEIETAAKAGYNAIEPWIRDIQTFVNEGGNLKDIKKRLDDHGMTVESAIGFAPWIVDDDQKRAQGLQEMRRDMELLREMGGKRIAAPPVGATDQTNLNLLTAAARYRDILQLGETTGVVPQARALGLFQVT